MMKTKVGAVTAVILIMPFLAAADMLTRQLEFGMTGGDVSLLQTFLGKDSTIYPQGLVTGYFGSLTRGAVRNFQARNGIDQVGRVGPITLAAINSQMAGGTVSGDVSAPIISNIVLTPSSTSTTITWVTNENAMGTLYYSTIPIYIAEGQNGSGVSVSGTAMAAGNGGFNFSQTAKIENLLATTTYYYVIKAADQSGNINVTWPATFRTTN